MRTQIKSIICHCIIIILKGEKKFVWKFWLKKSRSHETCRCSVMCYCLLTLLCFDAPKKSSLLYTEKREEDAKTVLIFCIQENQQHISVYFLPFFLFSISKAKANLCWNWRLLFSSFHFFSTKNNLFCCKKICPNVYFRLFLLKMDLG